MSTTRTTVVYLGVTLAIVFAVRPASLSSATDSSDQPLPNRYLYTIPAGRALPADFWNARALAIGIDGTVYVRDDSHHRVQMFTPDGDYLGQWGELGREEGRFSDMADLKVAADGTILVADHDSYLADGRTQRFDSHGRFLGLASAWELGAPAPDGSSFYVLAYEEGVVRRFDMSGKQLTSWGKLGTAPGEFQEPSSLVVAEDGTVIVGDSGNARIQRFSPTGRFLDMWGKSGSAPGEFRGWLQLELTGPDELVVFNQEKGAIPLTRLQRFTTGGQLLGEIPVPHNRDIITDFGVGPDRSIYLMYQFPGVVMHLAPDGTELGYFGGMTIRESQVDGSIDASDSGDLLAHLHDTVVVLGRLGEVKATVAYTQSLGLAARAAVSNGSPVAGSGDTFWIIAGERHYRTSYDSTLSLHVAHLRFDGSVRARWPLEPYDERDLDTAALPSLAVMPEGDVVLLDRERRRLQHFDASGGGLATWPLPEKPAGYAERLQIDGGPDGSLYLLQDLQDERESRPSPPPRITRFDTNGTVEESWTFDADINERMGNHTAGSHCLSVGADGTVYIGTNRLSTPPELGLRGNVQAYSLGGRLLGAWGQEGFSTQLRREAKSLFQPTSLAATSGGRLYVVDNAFQEEPRVIRVFGTEADDTWRAVFFRNREMAGFPLDGASYPTGPLSIDWGDAAPSADLPADGSAARLRGSIEVPAGTYRFSVEVLGGARLWVGNQLLVDQWNSKAVSESAEVFLGATRSGIQLDYTDVAGPARLSLDWQLVRNAPAPLAIPLVLTGSPTTATGSSDSGFNLYDQIGTDLPEG